MFIRGTIRALFIVSIIVMVLLTIVVSHYIMMSSGDDIVKEPYNYHTILLSRNGYTITKIIREQITSKYNDDTIYIILIFIILLPASIILLAYIRRSKNKIVNLRINVKTHLVNNDNSNIISSNSNITNRMNDKNTRKINVLAKDLARYPDNLLKLFLKTFCRSHMNVIILIEKYPSDEANKIIDIIRKNALKDCVQLKYVRDHKLYASEVINVDEIMNLIRIHSFEENEIRNQSLELVSDSFDNSSVKSNKLKNNVIVFGRNHRFILDKELYESLKKGINLKELRDKYGISAYNLVMKMYGDGVILLSNDKAILID